MAILPKVIYRLNAILIKLPMTLFTEQGNKHLKLHIEPKESPHSQDNPKQKEIKLEASRYLTSNYITRLVIKTKWYWYQNRDTDQ